MPYNSDICRYYFLLNYLYSLEEETRREYWRRKQPKMRKSCKPKVFVEKNKSTVTRSTSDSSISRKSCKKLSWRTTKRAESLPRSDFWGLGMEGSVKISRELERFQLVKELSSRCLGFQQGSIQVYPVSNVKMKSLNTCLAYDEYVPGKQNTTKKCQANCSNSDAKYKSETRRSSNRGTKRSLNENPQRRISAPRKLAQKTDALSRCEVFNCEALIPEIEPEREDCNTETEPISAVTTENKETLMEDIKGEDSKMQTSFEDLTTNKHSRTSNPVEDIQDRNVVCGPKACYEGFKNRQRASVSRPKPRSFQEPVFKRESPIQRPLSCQAQDVQETMCKKECPDRSQLSCHAGIVQNRRSLQETMRRKEYPIQPQLSCQAGIAQDRISLQEEMLKKESLIKSQTSCPGSNAVDIGSYQEDMVKKESPIKPQRSCPGSNAQDIEDYQEEMLKKDSPIKSQRSCPGSNAQDIDSYQQEMLKKESPVKTQRSCPGSNAQDIESWQTENPQDPIDNISTEIETQEPIEIQESNLKPEEPLEDQKDLVETQCQSNQPIQVTQNPGDNTEKDSCPQICLLETESQPCKAKNKKCQVQTKVRSSTQSFTEDLEAISQEQNTIKTNVLPIIAEEPRSDAPKSDALQSDATSVAKIKEGSFCLDTSGGTLSENLSKGQTCSQLEMQETYVCMKYKMELSLLQSEYDERKKMLTAMHNKKLELLELKKKMMLKKLQIL